MEKRGRTVLIILVVVLILLFLGALLYYLFIRDTRSIQGYTYKIPNFNNNEICDYYPEKKNEICVQASDSIIYYGERETNDIILFTITKGSNEHKSLLKSSCDDPINNCNNLRNVVISYPSGKDRPTFVWYYSDNKFLTIKQWGDSIDSVNSKVLQHYMEKYPPIKI